MTYAKKRNFLNQAKPDGIGMARIFATLVLIAAAATTAQPQTFSILHSFRGGLDGTNLYGGVILDARGNVYGTTYGAGNSGCSAPGCGTVFRVNPSRRETVLYRFAGMPDGQNSTGTLVRDSAGNLYGTTQNGGTDGHGTVFKLDTTGTETVLHSFANGPTDGGYPSAGLIRDAAGNLYGTTPSGGTSDNGTVFKVDSTGVETVLHLFTNVPDGASPNAGLIRDAAGNLYGTTIAGGVGYGTVFKVSSTGVETVLYSFTGGTDGLVPEGGLVRDSAGNLYGTTFYGGVSNFGTVFKLNTTGLETVLYSFTGGGDGQNPQAGLVRDTAGNLYGTTEFGGTSNLGTVFKLDTSGIETVLHTFTGTSTDGRQPFAGVTLDTAGNLYGTTFGGGAFGFGIVFKLTP
jgi:uncharacterized repeat protein (TIGR03803 family)